MSSTFGSVIVWGLPVLGMVPLASTLLKRANATRSPGAHAKTGDDKDLELGHPIRLATISVLGAFDFLVHPHGLVDWLAIGTVVVVLLWDPAKWLTAYLVHRSNSQGVTD